MRGVSVNGKPWTMEQMRDLRNMRRAGFSWPEISERCGHSIIACKAKVAVLGAVFSPPSEIVSASEREIQAQEFLENREREACDSLLDEMRKHHPARAGELVMTDKGVQVIGGTAEKPRLLPAAHCVHVPESGPIIPAARMMPTSSCALTW